jgi:DNA-binding NtrC family response regulator
VWEGLLDDAGAGELLIRRWTALLREAYPELAATDLESVFLRHWRRAVAEHRPWKVFLVDETVSPMALPGWLAFLQALAVARREAIPADELGAFARCFTQRLLERCPDRQELRTPRLVVVEPPRSEPENVLPESWTVVGGMVGSSRVLATVIRKCGYAARDEYPVLITGETGVGKELASRYIHQLSNSRGPFIPVNCAALPASLVESELFGHVRGAFTGAHLFQPGLFVEADQGTLLLDEITEVPLTIQAKILRTIQDGMVRHLGAARFQQVHVRVIATTNRNLKQALDEGRLRRDLYYRLAVHHIHIPPLRERREDIPELIAVFLRRWQEDHQQPPPRLTKEGLELLKNAPWPGNIRQLEHTIHRLALRYARRTADAPEVNSVLDLTLDRSGQTAPPPQTITSLRERERQSLVEALRLTGGNKAEAARRLGISRKALYDKLRRLGIEEF